MSALCIITTPDEVVIATDGGSFRPDGSLAGIAGKVTLIPEASCAVTFRGPRWALDDLSDAVRLSAARLDLDAILGAAPGYVERVTERMPHADRLEVCIVGWSERRQMHEAWAVRSYTTDDVSALAPFRLPECYTPNEVPPETAQTFGLLMPSTGETQWRREPFKWAALAIAALRFCPSKDHADDPDGYIAVGGFVQVTRISRHAIASEIVQEWPDPTGQLIDPEACLAGLDGPALAERVFGPFGRWSDHHAN